MKNYIPVLLVILLILLVSSVSLFAQPGGGGPGTPTPFGFVEILVLGGAAYGAKKLHQNKKDRSA